MAVADSPPPSLTEGLVPVGHFHTSGEAQEYALVVLAMGLDCLITVQDGGYLIHSEEAFEESVREEFRLYREEQVHKPTPAAIPVFRSGFDLALIWIVVLLFCFARQLQVPGFEEAYLNSSSALVEGGQWYRAFTSLFLHGDMQHLLGNATFGLVFGLLAANSFGPLRGWGLILLGGFLGNLATVWVRYPDEFRSLGASTAVFAALGLLVGAGLEVAWRERSFRRGLQAFAPLCAGLMIFTMSGIGGPGVDTLAHVTGMLAGIVLGLPAAMFITRNETR